MTPCSTVSSCTRWTSPSLGPICTYCVDSCTHLQPQFELIVLFNVMDEMVDSWSMRTCHLSYLFSTLDKEKSLNLDDSLLQNWFFLLPEPKEFEDGGTSRKLQYFDPGDLSSEEYTLHIISSERIWLWFSPKLWSWNLQVRQCYLDVHGSILCTGGFHMSIPCTSINYIGSW